MMTRHASACYVFKVSTSKLEIIIALETVDMFVNISCLSMDHHGMFEALQARHRSSGHHLSHF